MRYKPEHKEQTHRRIVETASREFRTHGFEGVGISTLMGALKLTHGGFYAHFADKKTLSRRHPSVGKSDNATLNVVSAARLQGGR